MAMAIGLWGRTYEYRDIDSIDAHIEAVVAEYEWSEQLRCDVDMLLDIRLSMMGEEGDLPWRTLTT